MDYASVRTNRSPSSRHVMKPVFVVDDDTGIREVIASVLEDEGFTVSTASDGEEALDQIAVEQPALVLLDLQMPGMNGWDVLASLREAHVPVPVVLMSAGYRAQAEAERCHADGYLAKP